MSFTDTIYHSYTPFTHKNNFYTCTIFEIDGKRRDSKGFNTHLEGKTDNDVEVVRFMRTKNFKEIPKEICEVFKNVKILIIEDCKLSEISRENFCGLENLREFLILHSQVRFLAGDLFNDLKSLESFGFIDSKISTIEENILEGLKDLKAVYLVQNPVINAVYIDSESLYQLPPPHQFSDVTKVPSIPEMCRLIKNCSPCSSVCSDLKNLLHKESYKDFTITIKNSTFHGPNCTDKCCNEVFKIHKFLLVARSETIAKMILTLPEVRNLNLVDIPSHAFKRILEYLYDGILPRGDKNLKMKDVYLVANKLGLRELKEFAIGEIGKKGCEVVEDNLSCDVDHEGKNEEVEKKKEDSNGSLDGSEDLKDILDGNKNSSGNLKEIEDTKISLDGNKNSSENLKEIEDPKVILEVSKIKLENSEVKNESFGSDKTVIDHKSVMETLKDQEDEFGGFVNISKDLTTDPFEIIDDFYDEVCSLKH